MPTKGYYCGEVEGALWVSPYNSVDTLLLHLNKITIKTCLTLDPIPLKLLPHFSVPIHCKTHLKSCLIFGSPFYPQFFSLLLQLGFLPHYSTKISFVKFTIESFLPKFSILCPYGLTYQNWTPLSHHMVFFFHWMLLLSLLCWFLSLNQSSKYCSTPGLSPGISLSLLSL